MAPAPGSFHVLVAKNLKILRLAINKTSQYISSKASIVGRPAASSASASVEPVYARVASRQPIHPAAFLKQSKRWLSSSTAGYATASVRRFGTSSNAKAGFSAGAKYNRASFPVSRVGTAVNRFTGRAPFASTLRPNLTGGTLGRTAGGYSSGAGRIGGARYFSHAPAAQAQVISNVSQAVRAFCLNGQRALYDGVDARSGKSRFRAVSALQEQAVSKMEGVPKASPGSYIDFSVNPTITALTPLNAVTGFKHTSSKRQLDTLNTEGLLDILSIDFSRSLKELAVILNDLKRLSSIGDLPITYQHSSLRVHFPGCDAQTVEKLSLELDLQRGTIGQDADFDAFAGTEIALLFPFAPSKTVSECSFYEKPVQGRQINRHDLDPYSMFARERDPILFSERGEGTEEFSTCSNDGLDNDIVNVQHDADNPWADTASPSGYDSLHSSELESSAGRVAEEKSYATPLEYQGIEGIRRFMEFCDRAGR